MPAGNTLIGGGAYGTQAPMSGYPQTQITQAVGNTVGHGTAIIDATPMRVVTLAILAAGGLVALRWSGFKFNVTAGV